MKKLILRKMDTGKDILRRPRADRHSPDSRCKSVRFADSTFWLWPLGCGSEGRKGFDPGCWTKALWQQPPFWPGENVLHI